MTLSLFGLLLLVMLIFRVRALEGPVIDYRTGEQLERARLGRAFFLALLFGAGLLALRVYG
jgi:hypothetical protein